MVALELGSLLAMPDMVKKNTWQTQAVGFGSMRVKDITHRSWRCLSAMGFHSIFRIALAWHPQLPVPLACCPKASTAASPTFFGTSCVQSPFPPGFIRKELALGCGVGEPLSTDTLLEWASMSPEQTFWMMSPRLSAGPSSLDESLAQESGANAV